MATSSRAHKSRPILVAAAVLALAGMLATGVALHSERAEAGWPAGKPRSFVVHHDGSGFDVVTEAPRRSLFTFNAWEHELAAEVKRTNPDAIVLVYKDLASTRSYTGAYDNGRDAALLPTGVGYGYADANHPEWFLTDPAGQRLEWGPWPDHWFMDIGNADYQEQWYQNVLAEVRANGWDGVFMDNALTGASNYGTPPAKYPTNEAMQGAVRSMLANVGPRLRAEGLMTIANINESRLYPGLWEDWIQLVDGAMEEWFVNWSSTVGDLFVWDWEWAGWRTMVEQVETAERLGRTAIVRSGGNPADPEAARYGLGSYLLAAEGRAMYSFRDRTWFPELEYDLGEATSPMEDWGGSVYARHFERGLVVVNASDAPTTAALPGAYLDVTDVEVTALDLGATRAAILRTPPTPETTTTTTAPTTTTTVPPTTTTTVPPTTTTTAPTTTTTAPTTTTTAAPTTTTTAAPTTTTTVPPTTTTTAAPTTTTTAAPTTTTTVPPTTTTTVAPSTTTTTVQSSGWSSWSRYRSSGWSWPWRFTGVRLSFRGFSWF